jgi:hypothetical protein
MTQKNTVCVIPRNINKPDIIVSKPVTLDWKQIGFLSIGVGLGVVFFQSDFSSDIKVISSAVTFGIGALCAFYKHEGSSVDDIAVNYITYVQRKNFYKKGREDIVVKINYRESQKFVGSI